MTGNGGDSGIKPATPGILAGLLGVTAIAGGILLLIHQPRPERLPNDHPKTEAAAPATFPSPVGPATPEPAPMTTPPTPTPPTESRPIESRPTESRLVIPPPTEIPHSETPALETPAPETPVLETPVLETPAAAAPPVATVPDAAEVAAPPEAAGPPAPFQDVMGLIAPIVSQENTTGHLTIGLNQPDGIYRDGEVLMLTISANDQANGYLTVDYYDPDGTVVHMLPVPVQRNDRILPGQHLRLGTDPATARPEERYYQVQAPFGPGLIVAILTDKPLFSAERTEAEVTKTYLPRFQAALERATAENGVLTAATASFETRPRGN